MSENEQGAVVYGRYAEVEDCAVAWWRRNVHDMSSYMCIDIRIHPSIFLSFDLSIYLFIPICVTGRAKIGE